jgi:DNA-binding protein H-NS
MTAFKRALELDPDDYRATDAIESAQEGANRIKEGKKHAEEMLKKQQENDNANTNSSSKSNSGSNSNARPAPKHTPTRPPLKPKAKTSPVG